MNETTKSQTDGEVIELPLGDLIKLLLSKFYLLVIAGIVAAGIVFLAVTFLVTPKYQSRVSFYVYNSTGSSQTGTINNSDLQAAESLAATYAKILASNSILDAVLEDMDVDSSFTRDELSGMVNVSVITNTQLLEVVVTSTDPAFACEIAESFANVAEDQIVRITMAGGVEVVDQPEVATKKSSPRTLHDSAMGFVAGVVIAAAIIIIRNLSDKTINLPDDIKTASGVTVLGQIPTISDAGVSDWQIAKGGAVRYETKENPVQEEN